MLSQLIVFIINSLADIKPTIRYKALHIFAICGNLRRTKRSTVMRLIFVLAPLLCWATCVQCHYWGYSGWMSGDWSWWGPNRDGYWFPGDWYWQSSPNSTGNYVLANRRFSKLTKFSANCHLLMIGYALLSTNFDTLQTQLPWWSYVVVLAS